MPILPDFDAATFVRGAAIDNPFLPYIPGTIQSYAGSVTDDETGETESENNDVFVSFENKIIDGVTTTVVRDTAYDNGVLVEDTLDWYAQDDEGNVWYLGEHAINYEYDDDGNYVETNTDGSWEHAVDGALAGWVMQAEPGFGASYYQEFYEGEAVDEGIVVGVGEEVSGPAGEFEDVLRTLDTTALEPDVAEFKYYAEGVGQIRADEGLDEEGEPELIIELQSTREVERDDEDDDNDDDDGDDDDEVEFALGDLEEAEPLDDAEDADDPDVEEFEGDGGEMFVTFLNEDAGYNNSIGAFVFDTESGEIGEGRMLFTDTDGAEAGDSVSICVEEGESLGVFIVADGANLGINLEEFESGGLFFGNFLTGETATVNDGLAPLVMNADGDALPIQALNAIGNDDGFNFLNPAAGVQAVELESEVLDDDDDDDGDIALLGFEDLQVTNQWFDGDYNDVVVAVGDAALEDAQVRELLDELGVAANGADIWMG